MPALTFISAAGDQDLSKVFVWSLVLIVLLVLMFGALQFYRKWMSASGTTSGAGFTLSDLRKLHKEGKMTTEEFDKAKALIIGDLKKAAANVKPLGDKTPVRPPVEGGSDGGTTPGQGPRSGDVA